MQDTKKFVRRDYRFSSIAALVLFTCMLLTAGAWGQGSPVVYVSASGGLILRVDTSTGASTTLTSNSNAAYEGLVVGPDNVDAGHSYLLYACDPTNNTIIRFDPTDVAAGVDTVYSGGALQQPQCGRFTNTGDLIVGSKVPGSGLWMIKGVAGIGLGTATAAFPAPTQNPAPKGSYSATQVSQGLAQKNIGDLLVVDSANMDVIRSQYATIPAFSGPPSIFIPASALLPGPFGIARKSTGDIYVSNQSKKANNIVHYNAQGSNGSACVAFSNKTAPAFMQMSADDTLYVATASSSSGAVYSVNATTCVATQVPTGNSLPPLVGIALPPTTVTQTKTFNGTWTFNFGFAAYQVADAGNNCTLTVTAMPVNPGVIQSEINDPRTTSSDPLDPFYGGSPAVNLGWDGFQIVFDVPPPASCPSLPPLSSYGALLSADVDNLLVSNPRVVRCGTPQDLPDGCSVITMFNDYPLDGPLPGDGSYGGKTTKCTQFIINGNPTTSESELGQFCGFQTPLSNVGPPAVFSSGQNLSVKFKLASTSGTCQNGPYITDATALMSVAQIYDKKGNSVFNPISLDASGSSTPIQPIFKTGNQQYQFSLSLQGYAPGTYSLTVTFLSANTVHQTVLFKVQ